MSDPPERDLTTCSALDAERARLIAGVMRLDLLRSPLRSPHSRMSNSSSSEQAIVRADGARQFLRHAVATLAYRAEKVLRDAAPDFAGMRPSPASRTSLEVLSHLGDLMEWALSLARGENRWQAGEPQDWAGAHARFFQGLAALDAALAEEPFKGRPTEMIFQGPIADALTHVGQLAMLRGMSGRAVRPESYARADIRAGSVGSRQPAPRAEFDGDASRPK